MKLLMIEDNKSVCEMMSMFFEKEKWDVEYAYDGISAVEKFKEKSDEWDMITLDLNLPGMDGMQVNAEIRKISSTVPIIILTARDSESDQILGLEMGADEYVSKPFSPITLIARIKAILKRSKKIESDIFIYKGIKVDFKGRVLYIDNKEVNITPKEFELLSFFIKNPNTAITREQILNKVWGYETEVETNVVDVYIRYLRNKIDVPGDESYIQTVRGTGYVMRS